MTPVAAALLGSAATLLVACAAPAPASTGEAWHTDLAQIDAAWFRAVVHGEPMRRYLAIPAGSVHLARIPADQLTRLALAESFLRHPSWPRIWYVAARWPDAFSGVAFLNHLVRNDPANFAAWQLAEISHDGDPSGFEAALFAHIEDERSRPSRWDPATWVGDTAGYHHNAYLTCAEFLARRNQPYMAAEWDRLARFERNRDVRVLAEGCLRALGSRDGAAAFSERVAQIRRFRQRVTGLDLSAVSTHDLLGEKREVREYEIRFLGRGEPVEHHLFEMIGLHGRDVGGGGGLFRRRPWPHRVALEAGSGYLDQVGELFALLARGEPGEVRREYATFLVVRGKYEPDLEPALRAIDDALPPHAYRGSAGAVGLFVFRVLNEDLDTVRELVRARLPLRR